MTRHPTFSVLGAILIGSLLPIASSYGDMFSVSPQASFLRTDLDDSPASPTIINLSQLSFPVIAGDTLILQRIGAISAWSSGPGATDTYSRMAGLFSLSNTILNKSNLNRVPGAIDAGADYDSGTTSGGLTTDITQDFLIDDCPGYNLPPTFSSVSIQVPLGAQYLFVGTNDSYYGDNVDPNGDFAVSVSLAPEPASLMFIALGAAGLLIRRRHK